MIRVVTGNLGSGKTYYAVNYLKNFCEFLPLYNQMILDSSVLLVTNIDTVQVQHIKYEDFRDAGMMNIENLKTYLNEHNYKRCVLIIDECQRYFANLKDTTEYFFFEYSRHLGLDIFLIVQSVAALPRRLVELSEFVIEAQPRNLKTLGFRYHFKDSKTGAKLSTQIIKTDQTVFRLYKSFDKEEFAKPKNTQLPKIIAGIVVIAIIFISMKFLIGHAFSGLKPKEETKQPGKAKQQVSSVLKKPNIESDIRQLSSIFPKSHKMIALQGEHINMINDNHEVAGAATITDNQGKTTTYLFKKSNNPPAQSAQVGGAHERVGESVKESS